MICYLDIRHYLKAEPQTGVTYMIMKICQLYIFQKKYNIIPDSIIDNSDDEMGV